MSKKSLVVGAAAAALSVATAVPAGAHVSPTTYGATYTAGATNVFYLRVPHACEDPDTTNSPGGTALTSKLVVDVPSTQVASVKPQFIPGWTLSTVKDGTGAVTQITWETSDASFALPDTSFMDFGIRATLKGSTGDKVLLPTHQHCDFHANGTAATGLVEEWIGADTPTLTLVGTDKAVNTPAQVAEVKGQKATVDALSSSVTDLTTRTTAAESILSGLKVRVNAQVEYLVAVMNAVLGRRPLGDVSVSRGSGNRLRISMDLSSIYRNRTVDIVINGSKVASRKVDNVGDSVETVEAKAPSDSTIEIVVGSRVAAKSTF